MLSSAIPNRGRLAAAVLTVAVLGAALEPVGAADLGDLPPLPAIAEPTPTASLGAGWYLRGDIGYSAYGEPDAVARAGGASVALTGEEADAGFAFGLGAGYRFSPWVRADVTVDHRAGSDVTLFSGGPAPAARGQADLSTTAALANVYLDLGTWYGFTPYVGAGAGYAWTRLDSYAVTGCGAPCPSGGVDLAAPTASIGHTQGDFAYALMAGVSVDAGRSLSVDLGYRYLSLGEARTGSPAATAIETGRLDAHEARVGIRWSFGGPARATPISRSY